jgi:hypothetical protein
MLSKQKMVNLLLSDPSYTLPDVDYSTQTMVNRLNRMRTNIAGLQTLLDTAPTPEEKQIIENSFKEAFPDFNKSLIPIALAKINDKLPSVSSTAGSKKKRKIKRKNRTRR